MFLSWGLLLQFLTPERFKFSIFTETSSRELDRWQSAAPAGFQLNAFTLTALHLCSRNEGSGQILHSFPILLAWPVSIRQ